MQNSAPVNRRQIMKLKLPTAVEKIAKIFFPKFCGIKFSLTFAIPKNGVVL